jgi:repressor LexA
MNTEQEMVSVPEGAANDGEYVLRLRGDSMVDAGMLDGDNLVVRSAETAADGEIVVAMVGKEATVKRWRVDPDGTPWLEPANAELEPVRGVDVRVVGRVVGLFRFAIEVSA